MVRRAIGPGRLGTQSDRLAVREQGGSSASHHGAGPNGAGSPSCRPCWAAIRFSIHATAQTGVSSSSRLFGGKSATGESSSRTTEAVTSGSW